MRLTSLLLLACAAPVAGACSDDTSPTGTRVALSIAPLSLPSVVGVEYALAVFNAPPGAPPWLGIFDDDGVVQAPLGDLVWSQPSVTSNQFGNGGGGDIAYVGPCDAQGPGGQRTNYVALALKQINVGDYGGSLSGAAPTTPFSFVGTNNILDDEVSVLISGDGDPDFENPCDYVEPCVLSFPCKENQDTEVTFNLTVLRDADQGFFDVAVNFEDIFCSAKFDTCYDGGEPIELLFGDDTDTNTATPDGLGDEAGRDRTGVFALACTASPGSGITTDILLGAVMVQCPGNISFDLPVAGLSPAAGNHSVQVDLDGDLAPDTVQYALYFGAEGLDCGEEGACNKAYLNIAINLEDLPLGCTLSLQATAQDGNANPTTFTAGSVTTMGAPGTTYPFVAVDGADLSQSACVRDGLEDGGSVSTFYGSTMEGGELPDLMCTHSLGGADPEPVAGPESSYPNQEIVNFDSISIVNGQLELVTTLTNNGDSPVRIGRVWIRGFQYYSPDVDRTESEGCGLYPNGLWVNDNSSLAPGQQRGFILRAGPWSGPAPAAHEVQIFLYDDSGNRYALGVDQVVLPF